MGKLYIIATPIGNLEDITLRALRILKEVDLILCEDTRKTRILTNKYKIDRPLLSYHQHSKLQKIEQITEFLKNGKNLALVSDAGTPGISDPGGKLINYLTGQLIDLQVIPIPGPSALTAAASISGLPTDKFLFLGFPPHKKGRNKFFQKIAETDETVIFYESTYRILKSLNELKAAVGGDRQIVVCRELTKMFETTYRGNISEVIDKLQFDIVKGEFVIVVNTK